jgi:ABC-type branched-subunit amino acid transport system substrate-binding protein
MQRLGMKLPLLGNIGLWQPTFVGLAQAAAEGTIVAGQVDPAKPSVAALQKEWIAKFHPQAAYMDPVVVGAYDAVMLLVEAIKKAGSSPTRASVVKAFTSLSNQTTVGGLVSTKVSFTGGSHDAFHAQDLALVQIKNGIPVGTDVATVAKQISTSS